MAVAADKSENNGKGSGKGNGNGNGKDSYPEVVYAGKIGRIIQIGPHTYTYDAKSRENYEKLKTKLDEIVEDEQATDSDEVTTQSHSDSGSGRADFEYLGHQGVCTGDCTADADNGTLTFDGSASASWYGEGYWVPDDEKVYCESITITSTLQAESENRDQSTISVPPGYTVSEEQEKATFDTGPIEQNVVSLDHNPGAITFEAGSGNCWNWAEQDDTFKFEFENGHVKFVGYNIRMNDLGHCLF